MAFTDLISNLAGLFRAKAVGGGSSGSLINATLGTGYADYFKRDRAPTQAELLSHLVGTAYRCANLNANLVSTTRLRLYLKTQTGQSAAKFVTGAGIMGRKIAVRVPNRRVKMLRDAGAVKSALLDAVDTGDGDIKEITEHPILDVLRNPENAMDDGGLSAYDHTWTTQTQLDSIGRAYWYIAERDKLGQPSKLQLLRSHLVREMPDLKGKVWIDHYEYGQAKIATADIIRFAMPDPSNPHGGFLSPLRAAVERIRLVRGGDAFTTALLENGGYPAGVWSPKGDSEGGGVGEYEAKRMASAFRRAFAMANAGKIMVSESPGVLQTLAWKPAEIIDVARSQELEGQIADCFDVPRTKMFRDSSNKASSESGDSAHAKDAGLPRCSRFEETLNGQLVPLFDTTGRLFLAFDSPVPADKVFELEQTKTGGSLGLTTLDEGRAAIGMDPTGGKLGESRVVANTMVLVSPDLSVTQLTPPAPTDTAPTVKPVKPVKMVRRDSLLPVLEKMASVLDRLEKKDGDLSGGHWVTMDGAHVYISDSDGTILAGPARLQHLVGTKPKESRITEHHRNHTDPKKPPKAKPKMTRTKEPEPSEKAKRAKAAHRMIAKADQNYAKEREPEVAKKLGGASFPDSEPVDVVVANEKGVVSDGVEVKRLMLQDTDEKLTMNKYAQVRKVVWEQSNEATYHTVVVDDRKIYNANGEGEHGSDKDRSYYYRRGIAGSARLNAMHEVKSMAEVKKLMAMPESELPAKAQRTDGGLRDGKWKPLPDKEGRGFKNSKTGEIVRPKK